MESAHIQLLDRLVTLLGRHSSDAPGDIPRRAVLANEYALCELRHAPPGSTECHLVSAICEAVKAARGDRVISRDVSTLLADCIHTDDDALWTALCDDAVCGLVSNDAIREHFDAHPHDAVAFIHRYRAARTPDQATRILKVCSMCVPHFSPEAHAMYVTELYHNDGVAYLVAFAHAAKSLPAHVRMKALTSMGEHIKTESIYRPLARGLLGVHTPAMHDDVLAILMASPCAPSLGSLLDDPLATLRHTLALASKAPVPRRGPYFVASAHLASHVFADQGILPPDVVHAVHALVQHTVHHDARGLDVLRAAAMLVAAIERDSMCGVLASAFGDAMRTVRVPARSPSTHAEHTEHADHTGHKNLAE